MLGMGRERREEGVRRGKGGEEKEKEMEGVK